jgi:hypothetical protein
LKNQLITISNFRTKNQQVNQSSRQFASAAKLFFPDKAIICRLLYAEEDDGGHDSKAPLYPSAEDRAASGTPLPQSPSAKELPLQVRDSHWKRVHQSVPCSEQ